MRAAGIETLLGKGSFLQSEGRESIAQFKLDTKDVGEISFVVQLFNLLEFKTLNMPELRSDIIARLPLGQPESHSHYVW